MALLCAIAIVAAVPNCQNQSGKLDFEKRQMRPIFFLCIFAVTALSGTDLAQI